MPKVLPRGYSISPAMNWATPPKAKAMAIISGSSLTMGNQPALSMLSSQVQVAKPNSPNGAGLASFMTSSRRLVVGGSVAVAGAKVKGGVYRPCGQGPAQHPGSGTPPVGRNTPSLPAVQVTSPSVEPW